MLQYNYLRSQRFFAMDGMMGERENKKALII
jgi:hypothetical protein